MTDKNTFDELQQAVEQLPERVRTEIIERDRRGERLRGIIQAVRLPEAVVHHVLVSSVPAGWRL